MTIVRANRILCKNALFNLLFLSSTIIEYLRGTLNWAGATAQGGQAHAAAGRMSVMALTEHHFYNCADSFWKIADHPAL